MNLHPFPDPTFFLPEHGEPSLRWGIIGSGWIASEFARAVHRYTHQRIVAVASRSSEKAAQFAAENGIDRSHGSVEQLIADPAIDAVYIATTADAHADIALQAIAAGKPVLVEKPFAMSAVEAQTVFRAAERAGVMAMEAMWTRYLPQTAVIRSILSEGLLGEIRSVHADHGQAMNLEAGGRIFDPTRGGGALMDLGIYPIQFDSMVLGAPRTISAIGGLTPSGVDAYSTVILDHGHDRQSTVTTSILAKTPTNAYIVGSAGTLSLEGPFYIPTTLTLSSSALFKPTATWTDPTPVRQLGGLSWEATAFASFVGEGRHESPVHTHGETSSILQTIDVAREQLYRVSEVGDRF